MTDHPVIRLFTPGPVHLSPKTVHALTSPIIGHRGNDFRELYASCQPGLQQLFETTRPVFFSTSSAWGIMEGALRNLLEPSSSGKILHCMCGAFSDKWYQVGERCGYQVSKLQVPWGEPILPEQLEAALAAEKIDIVTLVHNETSTGVLNPLPELAAVMKRYPETLFIVDTVSSFSTIPIPMEELGIDVMLTGCQKALALPPGAALFSISEKALKKAQQTANRGYYFDFLEFQKNHEENMTPSTPAIPHLYALASQLEEIQKEGLKNRYERHRKTNQLVHHWVRDRGFEFFACEGYRSPSLTCVANNQEIDIPAWIARLREKYHCIIDGGYGKIKGKTFRISNMGEETEATISQLLGWLDDTLVR